VHLRSSNVDEPSSEGNERFIGKLGACWVTLCQARGVSKTLHSIGNILIGEGWILPGANFKCQELVIRTSVGMIFKRVCHFRQSHRPSSCGGRTRSKSKTERVGGLRCRCWLSRGIQRRISGLR